MARIVLGVTGSVASLRTPVPPRRDPGRGARRPRRRHRIGPPLLQRRRTRPPGPRRPRSCRRLALSRSRRVGGRSLEARRPGPAHRTATLGRIAPGRADRCQHLGQVRPRPERQLPHLPVPRLGFQSARNPGPRDEHPDVAEPHDPKAPPAPPGRPRRWGPRGSLVARRGGLGLRPTRPGPDPGVDHLQGVGLRRRRRRRDGGGPGGRRCGPIGLGRRPSLIVPCRADFFDSSRADPTADIARWWPDRPLQSGAIGTESTGRQSRSARSRRCADGWPRSRCWSPSRRSTPATPGARSMTW